MSQTNYAVDPALAYRGLLGDPNKDAVISPFANGSGADVGFGIMVRRDATNLEDQFDNFSATGQTPLGILVHTHATQSRALAGSDGLEALEEASVLSKGRIWVAVEEAITVGDDVYFRHTAGTGTEIGAFRNDADTASCDQITNARWLQGSTGAGVALLEINIP